MTTPDDPAYENKPSDWNAAHIQLLTISGNTAGASTFSGTNLVYSAGPNATLSLNGNTLVFSGGAGAAGNTGYLQDSGGTTASLGTIVLSNASGVSWGISGQTLTASVKTDYLTTAMASNRGSDFVQATAAFNGTNASGTIASNAISVSVAAQTNQTVGLYGVGNTTQNSSTTLDARTISLRGNQDITVGYSNGSVQLSVNVTAAQSAQTAGWYGVGNTTQNSSTTLDARTMSIGGRGDITVGYSNGTIQISGQQTNQSAIKGLGVSNTGNTAGNTGLSTGIDWVIAGTNGITASESTSAGGPNTIWISGVTTAAQTNQTVGLYAVGNTTQNSSTTLDARTLSLNGLGALTVGYSNGSIDLSAPASSSLTGVLPISVSSNGSTISIMEVAASEWAPYRFAGEAPITNSSLGQSSLYFYPADIPGGISGSRLNMFISLASTTSGVNSTGAGSIGLGYGIYTRGTGANSDRLSLLTSYSLQLATYTFSSNTRIGITHYIGLSNATSHSTTTFSTGATNASTYLANSIGGYRAVALPLNVTLTQGRYWFGISHQSNTANTNAMQVTLAAYLQLTASNNIAFRPFGTSSAASDASVYGFYPGLGTYSAQSAAWPNSIGLTNSDIRMPVNVTYPYINISGIATSTNML